MKQTLLVYIEKCISDLNWSVWCKHRKQHLLTGEPVQLCLEWSAQQIFSSTTARCIPLCWGSNRMFIPHRSVDPRVLDSEKICNGPHTSYSFSPIAVETMPSGTSAAIKRRWSVWTNESSVGASQAGGGGGIQSGQNKTASLDLEMKLLIN